MAMVGGPGGTLLAHDSPLSRVHLGPGVCRLGGRASSRAGKCPDTAVMARADGSSEGEGPIAGAPEGAKQQAVGCKACGRAEMESGCNGEGRIQGGIGALPGFEWWPIKAYRPCPAFVQSGGRYRRSGQSLDEIAFGRKGATDDLDVSERLKR